MLPRTFIQSFPDLVSRRFMVHAWDAVVPSHVVVAVNPDLVALIGKHPEKVGE